jgi:uncharacterized membrane protein
MKRLVAFAALALAACAPMTASTAPPAPAGGVVAQAGTVILSGQRAFAAAELGYTTAATGVGLLVDAGVIHGAVATRVRGYNAEARKWLIAGKSTGDAAEQARAAAQLFGIADRLDAITGSN